MGCSNPHHLLERRTAAPPMRKSVLHISMARSLPSYTHALTFSWFAMRHSLPGNACMKIDVSLLAFSARLATKPDRSVCPSEHVQHQHPVFHQKLPKDKLCTTSCATDLACQNVLQINPKA